MDPAMPPRKNRRPPSRVGQSSGEKFAQRIRGGAHGGHESQADLRFAWRDAVARQIAHQVGQHHREIGAAEIIAGIAQRQKRGGCPVPQRKSWPRTRIVRLDLGRDQCALWGHTSKVPYGSASRLWRSASCLCEFMQNSPDRTRCAFLPGGAPVAALAFLLPC